jgi:hypothetical protein
MSTGLIKLIAQAIEDDVESVEIGRELPILSVAHGGSEYVVFALPAAGSAARLIEVERRSMQTPSQSCGHCDACYNGQPCMEW